MVKSTEAMGGRIRLHATVRAIDWLYREWSACNPTQTIATLHMPACSGQSYRLAIQRVIGLQPHPDICLHATSRAIDWLYREWSACNPTQTIATSHMPACSGQGYRLAIQSDRLVTPPRLQPRRICLHAVARAIDWLYREWSACNPNKTIATLHMHACNGQGYGLAIQRVWSARNPTQTIATPHMPACNGPGYGLAIQRVRSARNPTQTIATSHMPACIGQG